MAQSDNQTFLEDLLLRWDPDIDLSPGSEVQTQVIAPILRRISIDPFDEDILTFITTRIQETHPDLSITEVDALQDTVIDPMRVLLEPLIREVKLIKRRTDLGNSDSLSNDEVESLLGNFFERRNVGGYATGVIRIYFANPQGLTVSLLNAAVSKSSALRYFPTRPQTITATQMSLNVDGSEYYFDVQYKAERQGDEYNIAADEISDVLQLPNATRVINPQRFRNGTPSESSSNFVRRVEGGLGEKTLNTIPGVDTILSDAYPAITSILSVGAGEAEMMRDIINGGSLGEVPATDTTGAYYGYGTVVVTTSTVLGDTIEAVVNPNFIQKLGAQGSVPDGWWVSLTYDDAGTPIAVDAAVLLVVSNTQILVDASIPVAATGLVWSLRRREILISDIPGGIVFPNTVDGEIAIEPNEVHIGGHTDIYIAGEPEETSALIENLSDENPVATGVNAQTVAASAAVVLLDASAATMQSISNSMSLVLGEGSDAGSYRIVDVVVGTKTVTLEYALTASQIGLVWRIVDEIDVELTDPKEIRITGSDMVTVSGQDEVTTTGSVNFVEANVQIGDTLELTTEGVEGDYEVVGVAPTALTVDPVPTRSFSNIPYRVFRRSGALEAPIVRVTSVELTDSSGSPVGTTIPYRDPVLVESRGFANEGDGLGYNWLVLAGYMSRPFVTATGTWTITVQQQGHPTADTVDYVVVLAGDTPEAAAAAMNVASGGVVVCDVITLTEDIPDLGVYTGEKMLTAYSDVGPIFSPTTPFPSIPGLSWTGCDGSDIFFSLRHGGHIQEGDAIELINYVGQPPLRVGANQVEGFDVRLVYSSQGPSGEGAHSDAWDRLPLRPGIYTAKIGKPSVGVLRAYFLEPTSVTLGRDTRATIETEDGDLLEYWPDPDNRRQIIPPNPDTALAGPAEYVLNPSGVSTFTDADGELPISGIQGGDIIRLLAHPLLSDRDLVDPIAVGGTDFFISLDDDSTVQISFGSDLNLTDVVDAINDAVGVEVATTLGDRLRLNNPDGTLTIAPGSGTDALPLLELDGVDDPSYSLTTALPEPVELIVEENTVTDTLNCFNMDPPGSVTTPPVVYIDPDNIPAGTISRGVQYAVDRYVQRISSTEMQANVAPSGAYYVDIEMLSVNPGNEHNTSPGANAELEGHVSDGYRLSTDNPVLSYSRAEVLYAEFSRSILLPGSTDAPASAVQLSSANLRVNYDRSQLVDEVQSFVLADDNRVLCSNPLVRHLLPHYVRLNWTYVGGPTVPVMEARLRDEIDDVQRDDELEVSTLTKAVRTLGASSVYSNDSGSGRAVPRLLVVYHDEDRRVRAKEVLDIVDTGRIHKFFADVITLKRTSVSGIGNT